MTTRTGRPAMRSPGRPPIRRDVERAFWLEIAQGLTSEDAAIARGVPGPVGFRWSHQPNWIKRTTDTTRHWLPSACQFRALIEPGTGHSSTGSPTRPTA